MRRIAMTVMALGLAAAPAVVEAQPARGGAGPEVRQAGLNAAARVLALRGELELTAAQVSQLEQLSARFEEQHRTLREQLAAVRPEGMPRRGAAGRPAFTGEQQAQMRARMAEQRAQMAEQRAQMRERMAEQRARMQARRAERREVTAEQRAQMEARRAEQQARMQELRPLMQQLRQSQESARAQVESVLTSEQLAKLRELQQAGARQRPMGPRGAGPRR